MFHHLLKFNFYLIYLHIRDTCSNKHIIHLCWTAVRQRNSHLSLESYSLTCMLAFVKEHLYPFNKRMSELHNVPGR